MSLKFIKDLNPEYFLPFAGTYTLTGKLSKLQHLRGVPSIDKAYKFFDKSFENNYSTKSIKLNNKSTFDLNSGEYDKNFVEINNDKYNDYINKILSQKKLDYEHLEFPSEEEIFDLAKKAHKNFTEKKILNKIKFEEEIYIKFGSHSVKIDNNNCIDLIKNEKVEEKFKYIIFELDSRLLKWLLNGPKYAHWNNAEIGSHIRFFRNPNVYERNIFRGMCYLHN